MRWMTITAQSRNIPGMTGMLCCGETTIINGMVLEVSADKLGVSEAAGIDLGLPFEEK